MFFYSDDPVRDFEQHDRIKQQLLDKLPHCDHCREPIRDEYYFDIYGVSYCYKCMEKLFRTEVTLDE